MNENDFRLYHHGVVGMKWGVRRYQNYDGTLTPAGRRRLGFKDTIKETAKKPFKWYLKNVEDLGKIGDKIGTKAGESLVKGYRNAKDNVEQLKDVSREKANIRTRKSGSRDTDFMNEARRKDINQMSNKELEEYNRRLNLEKQFADLTKKNVSAGQQYVNQLGKQVVTGIVTGVTIGAGIKFVKDSIPVLMSEAKVTGQTLNAVLRSR